MVAEVEVDRATGMVSVPQTWAAVDSGLIINPDGLTSQIEGGIVQSVSWTLKEEVRFDKSGILARDWASYPILTMPEAPKVEIELINRPNERPLGAGEGSQGPAVAADRQCLRPRHRQTRPRPSAQPGAGQGGAGVDRATQDGRATREHANDARRIASSE